jgi:hypothetical protein
MTSLELRRLDGVAQISSSHPYVTTGAPAWPDTLLRKVIRPANLPQAQLGGVSVDHWCRWLQEKGFSVLKREGRPNDVVPCAQLVADLMNSEREAHWVYCDEEDEEGDVHDPSQVSAYFPADDSRMRDLSFYSMKILTLSVCGILLDLNLQASKRPGVSTCSLLPLQWQGQTRWGYERSRQWQTH